MYSNLNVCLAFHFIAKILITFPSFGYMLHFVLDFVKANMGVIHAFIHSEARGQKNDRVISVV